jgi:two-component system, NarL family, invasion response regulator UvrY
MARQDYKRALQLQGVHMIRIAMVDDHDIVRTGLKMLLEQDPEFQIVAEGTRGEDAIAICRREKIDVLLLDLSMPGGMSGIEAFDRLMASGKAHRIVILTQHEDLALLRKMLAGGVMGYLSKSVGAEELKTAIRRAHQGRRYVSADLAQQLAFADQSDSKDSPFTKLSPRELDTVIALVHGVSGAALARRLHISPKTVSTFKRRLSAKLGVTSDVALVRLAIFHGLVPEAVLPSRLGINKLNEAAEAAPPRVDTP